MDDLRNTIQHGDCIAGMQQLPAGSIDLAFADPPFNIGYEYDVYNDQLGREKYLDWSRQWISEVYRALKSDGTFWLAIGDEYAAELKVLSQEIGFHPRSWVIWYYTFGVNCKYKFTRSHAHLFYFVKDQQNFTFRSEDLENRIPSARELVYNDKRANPQGRLPDDTWIIRPANVVGNLVSSGSWVPEEIQPTPDHNRTWVLRPQDIENCFQAEEDTWYFPRVAGTFKERQGFHGCQMPEQLLGRIIRCCSEPGELVLDPFSGSGTTLAVAKKLNRNCIGFELSESYVTYGRERLAGVCIGDPLDGSAEPTKSAPRTDEKPSTAAARQRSRSKSQPSLFPDEARLGEAQLQMTLAGVLEAYRLVHQGWSVETLIVDLDANQSFRDVCQRLGLMGDLRTWNTLLLKLRQAGQLQPFEPTRQLHFDWEELDSCLFASEIALQRCLTDDAADTVLEVFSDPRIAARFDQHVSALAPDAPQLQARWGAVMLDSHAREARIRSRSLSVPETFGKSVTLSELDSANVSEGAGIYLLQRPGSPLYVGETLNLPLRLQQLQMQQKIWENGVEPVAVSLFPTETTADTMLAWQCCVATKYRPQWNYRGLIIAD